MEFSKGSCTDYKILKFLNLQPPLGAYPNSYITISLTTHPKMIEIKPWQTPTPKYPVVQCLHCELAAMLLYHVKTCCCSNDQIETVYACIQRPTQTRSSLPVRFLHARCSSEIICDTRTVVVNPLDENQDDRSAWILLRFIHCLECTPSASAFCTTRTFVEQF